MIFVFALGVIARSLFYLTYWKDGGRHNLTNFERHLLPVAGGVLIEVR